MFKMMVPLLSGLMLVLSTADPAAAAPRGKRKAESKQRSEARKARSKKRRSSRVERRQARRGERSRAASLKRRESRDGKTWSYRQGRQGLEVSYEARPQDGIHIFGLKADGYNPKRLIVDTRSTKKHPKEARWRGHGLYEAGILRDLHYATSSPMRGVSTAKLLKEVNVTTGSHSWPRPKPNQRIKKLADQIAKDALSDLARRSRF